MRQKLTTCTYTNTIGGFAKHEGNPFVASASSSGSSGSSSSSSSGSSSSGSSSSSSGSSSSSSGIDIDKKKVRKVVTKTHIEKR